ncbi:MAG: hypothetical protein AB1659_00540 [Thermodesulfobacteriota bacterium]
MRYFPYVNLEHFIYSGIPALILILIFAVSLGYHHFQGKEDELRKTRIVNRYPDRIEDRNAPFPLGMILIMSGAILWALGYILVHGLLGIRI